MRAARSLGRAQALADLGLKTAEVLTALQPHQQRVVDRLSAADQPGLVVAHGLGSGKTLTSIAAADALGLPTTVVTPAALQANYRKELDKHLDARPDDLTMRSLQGVSRGGKEALQDAEGLLVLDEAHRVRDRASKGFQAMAGAPAAKRMLLTASPAYNHPVDLAPLVNLAAGDTVLPTGKREFEDAFVKREMLQPSLWGKWVHGATPGERVSLKNDPRLTGALSKWVDYHANAESPDFPGRKDVTHYVPISSEQERVYNTLMGQAPAWIQYKVRSGLPPSKAESEDLNAFMTGVRQAQLYPGVFGSGHGLEHATKQQAAFRNFQRALKDNPEHRAVIYSNYLEAGLNPYHQLLERAGIPHAMFTGDMKPADRIQAVKDYNEGKLKALLLSSAGGEGLDLKGTRQIQILEPHFNEEKLKQVIGRGIRYKSHEHLPEEQRQVQVERYLSQMPQGFLRKLVGAKPADLSADQYLQMMAEDKERLNTQLREMLARTTPRTAG